MDAKRWTVGWSTALLVVLGLIISPSPGVEPTAGRSLREVQDEVRAALRRESQAKTVAERGAAIYELLDLHRAIVADERFATSETLRGIRNQLGSRLLAVKADLERQIRRQRSQRSNGSRAIPVEAENGSDPAILPVVDSLAGHLELVGAVSGGPARFLSAGAWSSGGAYGGGMGPSDFGPALVDLIQRTIHPDSWDVNGGLGTIVYYAPLHCLVVRATSEVHHDLGGGLRNLRDAGR